MTILEIDDDPDEPEVFKQAILIISPSTTCILAKNGYEALNILDTTLPDIIFLDINMPGMDGLECIENIRKIDRLQNIPIVVCSTTINPHQADCLKQKNARSMIKPTSFRGLVDSLKSLLSQFISV